MDLIDWSNYQWDKELVATVFHRFDVDAILRIPQSHRYVSDVLLWLHNKNGRYSEIGLPYYKITIEGSGL